ncbi:MAG: hypothetical protein IID61_14865 [SAR324 cluster bacterium]|nr:hypothetical protein [SAR324 cluster bacterium]
MAGSYYWSFAFYIKQLDKITGLLETAIDLFPALVGYLRAVVEGPLFTAGDLPTPTAGERRWPVAESAQSEQVAMPPDHEE